MGKATPSASAIELGKSGYLVLENGVCFSGTFLGSTEQAGEVVFNTSHSGYEEISTDPSYFNQILVMTAVQQGNYGSSRAMWESSKIHIQGMVCLEMQQSLRDCSWQNKLLENGVPILSEVDTRRLVLYLRELGTVWGAIVQAETVKAARQRSQNLIKKLLCEEKDWPFMVAVKKMQELKAKKIKGPRIAVIDFGVKNSIIKEISARASQIAIFPPRAKAKDILKWKPDGVLLSNGPGDPMHVKEAVQTVRNLLTKVFIFGICMGHQILALALGGSTYKLKFGHRGSNHPVRDALLNSITVTSQNHGYAVKELSLPSDVKVTHTNLNDGTIEGFFSSVKKCIGIQFHPESSPGPKESSVLFDVFIKELKKFKNASL